MAIRIGVLADSSLVARRLAPSRLVLCAAPGYLADCGRPAAPEDLARHDCGSYSYRTAGPEWRFRGPGGLHRVKVSGRLAVNNGDVLLAFYSGNALINALCSLWYVSYLFQLSPTNRVSRSSAAMEASVEVCPNLAYATEKYFYR